MLFTLPQKRIIQVQNTYAVVNAASGITTASRTWNTSLMVELMISI